jgi:hypothetical protein
MKSQLFASVATMSPHECENLRVEIANCKDDKDEAAYVELQVHLVDNGNEPMNAASI